MARKVVTAILSMTLFVNVAVAESNYAVDAGYGILATAVNLVYMPTKIVYGILGGVVGAIALAVTGGDIDTAKGVWSPTLGGHYVVTAGMLRNEEPLLFVGPSYYKTCDPVAEQWTESGSER
jgi:hypothetical protein